MFGLLVVLNNGAASAAPGSENVLGAVAFEIVLFAEHLALHGNRDAEAADVSGTNKQKALLF